ncbi:MAG: uracil-DNA glycosylase family protein [Neomegalonema sp.]|nr:uracil-DNA glycosylase family protein [Neomegalonema sp.]
MSEGEDASALWREIAGCTACAAEFAASKTGHPPRPVMQMAPQAQLCVAGQAPGWRAHVAGRPFDDPSGDRLRAWLGLARAQFYDPALLALLPMGFCFPGHDAKGGDKPPPPRCASIWRARLFAAHPALKLVLLVGGAAQKWHLGPRYAGSVTETVRNWRVFYEAEGPGPRYLPLPHPSWRNTLWLKRNEWFERETIPFVQTCISELMRKRIDNC